MVSVVGHLLSELERKWEMRQSPMSVEVDFTREKMEPREVIQTVPDESVLGEKWCESG